MLGHALKPPAGKAHEGHAQQGKQHEGEKTEMSARYAEQVRKPRVPERAPDIACPGELAPCGHRGNEGCLFRRKDPSYLPVKPCPYAVDPYPRGHDHQAGFACVF